MNTKKLLGLSLCVLFSYLPWYHLSCSFQVHVWPSVVSFCTHI
jgi:hypothetical protein